MAVQSPETTQGRDARSTVAEMESQETAGSTGVNSYVACLMLAPLRHAECVERCPSLRAKRKTPVSFSAFRMTEWTGYQFFYVKEEETLAEDLRLVVRLDPQTLSCV